MKQCVITLKNLPTKEDNIRNDCNTIDCGEQIKIWMPNHSVIYSRFGVLYPDIVFGDHLEVKKSMVPVIRIYFEDNDVWTDDLKALFIKYINEGQYHNRYEYYKTRPVCESKGDRTILRVTELILGD